MIKHILNYVDITRDKGKSETSFRCKQYDNTSKIIHYLYVKASFNGSPRTGGCSRVEKFDLLAQNFSCFRLSYQLDFASTEGLAFNGGPYTRLDLKNRLMRSKFSMVNFSKNIKKTFLI